MATTNAKPGVRTKVKTPPPAKKKSVGKAGADLAKNVK